MSAKPALNVLLVDPSLFTAPYDAALTEGLVAAGIEPLWATRPTRQGDRQEIPIERTSPFFYRRVDEAGWLPSKLKPLAKGAAHSAGLVKLLWTVWTRKPAVVHIQWIVVPPLDALAMLLMRRRCALVLTVHDTVPFNGERLSFLQNAGFDLPMRIAQRIVVHTESGRQTLIGRGVPAHKIVVIAHGPLRLQVPAAPRVERADRRYSFLLFGEIKPYKGLDLLLEALYLVPAAIRQQARVIVAGRPRMNLVPMLARIEALGLADVIEVRARRQSEEEMAELFVEADCFLFPYRQVDASGVWFLTKSLGRWMIASRVGIFAEELVEGRHGVLLPAGDAQALATAIEQGVRERRVAEAVSAGDEWATIGLATRRVYESLLPAQSRGSYVEARS
jgi:glycosyltransferase involved in cell wall biosynthesis